MVLVGLLQISFLLLPPPPAAVVLPPAFLFYNPRDRGALKMNASTAIDCGRDGGGVESLCVRERMGVLTANRLGSHL